MKVFCGYSKDWFRWIMSDSILINFHSCWRSRMREWLLWVFDDWPLRTFGILSWINLTDYLILFTLPWVPKCGIVFLFFITMLLIFFTDAFDFSEWLFGRSWCLFLNVCETWSCWRFSEWFGWGSHCVWSCHIQCCMCLTVGWKFGIIYCALRFLFRVKTIFWIRFVYFLFGCELSVFVAIFGLFSRKIFYFIYLHFIFEILFG